MAVCSTFEYFDQQPLRLQVSDSHVSFIVCKYVCCIEEEILIARVSIQHRTTATTYTYSVHGAQSNQQPNYIQCIQAVTNSSKLWNECNRTQFSFRLTFIWRKSNENGKRRRIERKTKIEFLIPTNFSFEWIRMNNDTCFLFNDQQYTCSIYQRSTFNILFTSMYEFITKNSEQNVDLKWRQKDEEEKVQWKRAFAPKCKFWTVSNIKLNLITDTELYFYFFFKF